MSLKNVKKCAGMVFVIYNKVISFDKDKINNKYIIKVGEKIYKFDSYKEAINSNIIKSTYGQWLTLKDLNKIITYNQKIKKIELKGKKIIIDDFDELGNNYIYNGECNEKEIDW